MPEELLPTVISSLQARIEEGFLLRSDQTSLLVSVQILCMYFSTIRAKLQR